jgi:hypothetical protein
VLTASAPSAERGFFPLDDRLGLLPRSTFSPRVHACLVRLGTELPFERVPELARLLLGVRVSVDTVRRLTEAAGAAQVAREEALCQQLRQTAPDGPEGPPVQQLSADGAMVPLIRGEWAEVRTIVLGTVELTGGLDPHATSLRYFSRLCSAARFTEWAELPLYEAGTAQAGTVLAIQDGATWLSQLVDAHCPDAVPILDFAHAAEHVATAAHATFGMESREADAWLDRWLHELKHGDPDRVIAAVRALEAPSPEAAAIRDAAAGYLARRRSQIAYATFRDAGYPIGSGAVESANKLVVEARLKGSGMHWARAQVTPMLALRALVCGGRWDEVWPQIWQQLRDQAHQQQRRRWRTRWEARQEQERARREAAAVPLTGPILPKEPPTMIDGRPTAHHPFRLQIRAPART